VGNSSEPVEVVDGLRVLGCPIGSISFCQHFLHKALTQAKSDTTKLSTSLESLQTILRLYSICSVHKLTHLFGCDVIDTNFDNLHPDIHLWNSDLTDDFSQMTEGVITKRVPIEKNNPKEKFPGDPRALFWCHPFLLKMTPTSQSSQAGYEPGI
jgi:hypothetical protein